MSVPALRFKEFEESWKKRPLSQIVGRLESGVSVNSLDEPITSSHDYGILKTSCISNGSFNAQENKKIIEEDITRAKLNPAKDSILVSRMNTPQLVGEVGYISCDYPNLFIPDRLWLIQTRDKLIDSAKWLNYQLTTPKLKNALTSIATGTSGSMKNIAQPSFLNLEVHTPALQEQAKIANFLSAVDEKITQLTQKHDLLTQYKKGVMQQIFSQELRFKDDDGQDYPDWKEMPLSDLIYEAEKERVQNPKDIELLTVKLHFKGVIRSGKYPIATEKGRPYYKRFAGELIIGRQNLHNGGVAIVAEEADGCIASNAISSFKAKHNVSIKFLFYSMTNPSFISDVDNAVGGTGQKEISTKQLMNITLIAPCEQEQIKVANFLTAIDDKITSTQAQLDAVKQYKQGLLQQMFV